MRDMTCTECGRHFDSDDEGEIENEICGFCYDAYQRRQANYWRPLYEAEKRAGLLKSDEELAQELRDAGRGR